MRASILSRTRPRFLELTAHRPSPTPSRVPSPPRRRRPTRTHLVTAASAHPAGGLITVATCSLNQHALDFDGAPLLSSPLASPLAPPRSPLLAPTPHRQPRPHPPLHQDRKGARRKTAHRARTRNHARPRQGPLTYLASWADWLVSLPVSLVHSAYGCQDHFLEGVLDPAPTRPPRGVDPLTLDLVSSRLCSAAPDDPQATRTSTRGKCSPRSSSATTPST